MTDFTKESNMEKTPLIEMQGITKVFPGVRALDNIDFELLKGEIHALVGENGAGKSTLMKVLFGVYEPDAGKILLNGKEVKIHGPAHAQHLGISMVHQEIMLVPEMNAVQNIALGREARLGAGVLNWNAIYKDARENLERIGMEIDLRTPIKNMSVATQQMIEIAKALSRKAEVIILDEPTSTLTPHEIEGLFKILKNLARQGVGIIIITHRLEEVFDVADRVTVFRDGKNIKTWPIQEITKEAMIQAMVGRKIENIYQAKPQREKTEMLRVENLCSGKVQNVSFTAYEGEILGIAGLVGAGRSELARAIFGADPIDSGKVFVRGEEKKLKTPKDAVSQGIGFLPEDRRVQGLVLSSSLESNVALGVYDRLSKYSVIRAGDRRSLAKKYVETLKVKPPYIERLVRFFSGGNQQKVVIAKWLAREVDIYIFDEPTRGIDVGSKSEIYQLLTELAQAGHCVIMISSELPEILLMSDRILVMREGKMVAQLERVDANQEIVMEYATGIRKQTEALSI